MVRKCLASGLLVVACLCLVAVHDAPSQPPTGGQGKGPPGQPGFAPGPVPVHQETVADLFIRLEEIKKQRAALDKEEQDIISQIMRKLDQQRAEVRAMEEKLRQVAPHLFKKSDVPVFEKKGEYQKQP
jgi:hypothetical protein